MNNSIDRLEFAGKSMTDDEIKAKIEDEGHQTDGAAK